MDKDLESIIEVVKERNDKGSRCAYDGCNQPIKNEYYINDGDVREGPFGKDHALMFLVKYVNGSGRKVRVPKEMQNDYEQVIAKHELQGSEMEVEEMAEENAVIPYEGAAPGLKEQAGKPAKRASRVYAPAQAAEHREKALMAEDWKKFREGLKFDYEQFAAQVEMIGQINLADRQYELQKHAADLSLKVELDGQTRVYQMESFAAGLDMQRRIDEARNAMTERKTLGDAVRAEYKPIDVQRARSYARAA